MYKQLTSEQRYTISVLLQKKCSLSFIAKTIGVCVSTVSWEKRRNSNVQGVYDGRRAALKARRRKATQREWATRKDHNHGQRDGVCSTWNHRKGIGRHGLLCTSILLLGKGRHREHERTCQAVPPQKDRLQGDFKGIHQENRRETQQQTQKEKWIFKASRYD